MFVDRIYSISCCASYFALGRFWRIEWIYPFLQIILMLIILVFKSSWCKTASAARNWINSVPQTTAPTFAFSFLFIFLLCHLPKKYFHLFAGAFLVRWSERWRTFVLSLKYYDPKVRQQNLTFQVKKTKYFPYSFTNKHKSVDVFFVSENLVRVQPLYHHMVRIL